MKTFIIWITLTLLLLFSMNQSTCSALPSNIPEHEELEYSISWENIIKVGTGRIGLEHKNGIYLLEMEAKSAPFFSLFFKVEDYFKSIVKEDFSSFLQYEKRIREGGYRRLDQVWYEPETGRIIYRKNKELEPDLLEPPPLFDPFSILFAYRFNCDHAINCTLTATDGKHVDRIRVVRVGEEKIQAMGRTWHTVKVQPVWKRMQGVFRKKKGGHVYVWFAKHPPYVPVKMEADIFIGKVVARLSGLSH